MGKLQLALILASIPAVPIVFYVRSRLASFVKTPARRDILRPWLSLLTLVLVLRSVLGVLMASGYDYHLFAVNAFYPFRIAYPNYGLPRGLPFALLCAAMIFWFRPIFDFLARSRWKSPLLVAFSFGLSLSFGAIAGGAIAGNIGVATEPTHLHDARINSTVTATFATHTARVAHEVQPYYEAGHSFTHPAGSVVYWQLVATKVPPILFSLINVFVFALFFPILYWAVRERFDEHIAFTSAVATIVTPALLVYGRSDDAVFYALAGTALSLAFVAIWRRRYGLTVAAAAVVGAAMNFSYASAMLLPAMFSFPADAKLAWRSLGAYLRCIAPQFAIAAGIVVTLTIIESSTTGFEYVHGFVASSGAVHEMTFPEVLRSGMYVRAFTERTMTILDFPVLGGPLMFYALLNVAKRMIRPIGLWNLKDLALLTLMAFVAGNMAEGGETARDWGSLYTMIGLCWLPSLLSRLEPETRLWLIQVQLCWTLLLKVVVDFAW